MIYNFSALNTNKWQGCANGTSRYLSQRKTKQKQYRVLMGRCNEEQHPFTSTTAALHMLDQAEEQEMTQTQYNTLSSLKSDDFEIDSVLEQELNENGFRSTRRTKIVCTIGPTTCDKESIETLAKGGMNVARLNMCHNTQDWHKQCIDNIRVLNKQKGYSVAIMIDTEGSEVHTDTTAPIKAELGERFTVTVRELAEDERKDSSIIHVNYAAFVEDVQPGDNLIVDGGMVLMTVIETQGPDVVVECVEPGIILSRANLTMKRNGQLIRGNNALLPVITSKDWKDIDFAIREKVDFIAVSFVKNADVLMNLKSYIATKDKEHGIEVIAKVESSDSVKEDNLSSIIQAADGVMVARGDLGAQISSSDVPGVQKQLVVRCRAAGKPVIIASQMLESMIEYPVPTRAEVADIADCVRQHADGIVLCGETAVGKYPEKCLTVTRSVATEIEKNCRQDSRSPMAVYLEEPADQEAKVSQGICQAATEMANRLGARAIFVFTKRGVMANFLSQQRPDCPIFAFTDRVDVRRRMNMRWGVMPFRVEFSDNPETNVERTFKLLKKRDMVQPDDVVVVVSDIRLSTTGKRVRSVQVRNVT